LSGQAKRKLFYGNHIFETPAPGKSIYQRVFDPAAKNTGSGITAAQGGFFCYFSCPPRKVEKKIRNCCDTFKETSVFLLQKYRNAVSIASKQQKPDLYKY
jgi:hypothetical protein